MHKIFRIVLPNLFAILVFTCSISSYAQTFTALDLDFGNLACDKIGENSDFGFSFRYTGVPFDAGNVFIVELSDANGDFSSPEQLNELTDERNFNQSATFQLRDGLEVYGTGYKIRVRSTAPEQIIESASFAAYNDVLGSTQRPFYADPREGLTVPDVDIARFTLCEGETQDVVLYVFDGAGGIDRITAKADYRLEKDGVEVASSEDPRFTISSPGEYFVYVDYPESSGGTGCGSAKSVKLIVEGIAQSEAEIIGASVVEICSNQSYEFETVTKNVNLTYNWFKDNVLIASQTKGNTAEPFKYSTATTNQFGVYKVQVVAGSCTVESSQVELKQETEPAFEVTLVSPNPATRVFLLGEQTDIEIATTAAAGYTVQWYKVKDSGPDEVLTASGLVLTGVVFSGVYYARVIENSSGTGCPVVKDSPLVSLLNPKEFKPVIKLDNDYEECGVLNTTLSIDKVEVLAEDDKTYILTEEQENLLELQWEKDGVDVVGATGRDLLLTSPAENGIYELEVSNNKPGDDALSEPLNVKLFNGRTDVDSTSSVNTICPGGDITYTINNFVDGYTYTWLKGGEPIDGVADNTASLTVTEVDEYSLQVVGYGCDVITHTFDVILFDEDAITVSPSERVVLVIGQTAEITAEGAETYEWYNADGDLIGTDAVLQVIELGEYTLIAKSGTCEVTKKLTVVEQDDQVVIPNLVSPNGDGINDTWQISNRYAFNPNVFVILYDSNGKEVLNSSEYKNDWPNKDLGNKRIFYYKIFKEEKLIKAGTIAVLD